MDFSINPLWGLADPVTVEQAAALIAGYDPSSVCFESGWPDIFRSETGLTDSSGIREVQVVFSALINAINGRKLQARLRYNAEPRYVAGIDNLSEQAYISGEVAEIKDIDECRYLISIDPNWSRSSIDRKDIIAWLNINNICDGFFVRDVPEVLSVPPYLNPQHPRYSKKMASAIKAWEAMDDVNLIKGKSPKSAMESWLESRYKELGLIYKTGINKTAIQEVAKVANWKEDGGAPSTPES